MVSGCLTWNAVTKHFFTNDKGLKIQKQKKHLEKELLPDTESIMKRNDCISIHVCAPSHHSNLVQEFLAEKLDKRFVKHTE